MNYDTFSPDYKVVENVSKKGTIMVECKECGDLVHDIVNDMCLMCNVLEDNARYLDTNVELGYSETS